MNEKRLRSPTVDCTHGPRGARSQGMAAARNAQGCASGPVRTLDALHFASTDFLPIQAQKPALASYYDRLNKAAKSLGIKLYRLP